MPCIKTGNAGNPKKDRLQMSKKTFILNDETVKNSYGFRVLTAGISLERFAANPVCLNNHSNHTKDVLGAWADVKADGALLTATPDFDTEDTDGKEVVRKVLSGKLKACSIGIIIEPEHVLALENGDIVVTKCELMEASIVAVPSNANAVVLYSQDGNPLTEQQTKQIVLAAQTAKPFTKPDNPDNMKILLSHLQLAEGSTEAAVLEAIKGIEAKLTASKNENVKLQADYDALVKADNDRKAADLSAKIDAAVKDGRIDADAKATFAELSYESATKLLATLKPRKPVAEQIDNPADASEKYEKLSFEELRKQNKLAALKAEFPDIYEQKFEEQFGYKPGGKK